MKIEFFLLICVSSHSETNSAQKSGNCCKNRSYTVSTKNEGKISFHFLTMKVFIYPQITYLAMSFESFFHEKAGNFEICIGNFRPDKGMFRIPLFAIFEILSQVREDPIFRNSHTWTTYCMI